MYVIYTVAYKININFFLYDFTEIFFIITRFINNNFNNKK